MRRSAGTGYTTELVILGSRGQYGWLVYSKLNAVRKGVPGDGGATRPKQSLATTQRPQRLTPPHPCEKERALRRPVVHFSVTTQTRAGGEICLAPPRRVQPGILTQPRMRARASPSRAASRGSRVPAAAEHRRSEFSMRRSAETGHTTELVILRWDCPVVQTRGLRDRAGHTLAGQAAGDPSHSQAARPRDSADCSRARR
jgi:hypothetical protein